MKPDPETLRRLPKALRIEIAENAFRADLTESELADVQERVLAAVRKDNRPGRRTDLAPATSAKTFAQVEARATDAVGRIFGESGRQVEKRLAVAAAAKAEPERFGKLVADMDRSGRVNGAFRRLQNIKAAAAIRAEPPPLPGNGPYRAGLIDIPWAYEPDDENASARGVLPYPTMSVEHACALDVRSLLAPDAAAGIWVTNFILAAGLHLRILAAWDLEPKTVVTWPKERVGRGHWAKGQTEHLVIATRGRPTVTLTDQTTLLRGPFHLVRKAAHSAKPVEAYAYFESLFPAPRYFDLFSRHRHNKRWDPHGNEAPAAWGNEAEP